METAPIFQEEKVRFLLSGGDLEIGQALSLIDHHLRGRLCGWLGNRFPGMSADDLANAWGETLLCVFRAVRGRRFDGGRALFPWLCQIARARVIDHTRRKTTREEYLAALGRASHGRDRKALNGAEKSEVMELIRSAIGLLPHKQRQVVQVFIDNLPETKNMEVLQREVSAVTGRQETLASVKRALQEGRQKVRAFLRSKDYGNPF